MKIKINALVDLKKSKIILFLLIYVIFSELIKNWAEVYILENSLEFKLLLLSLPILILYKVPEWLVIVSIIFFLILNIFGIETGGVVYSLICYSFFGFLKSYNKTNS